MARPVVDIRLIGDKRLIRALKKLPGVAQKKAVRPGLRRSAKRLKAHVVTNLSGDPVGIESGRWVAATIATPIRAMKRSRVALGVGFAMPTREELGIDPKDKWYYPAAVEYGTTERAGGRGSVPELRPIRSAVDDHRAQELATIGRDIGTGIEREWRKLNR